MGGGQQGGIAGRGAAERVEPGGQVAKATNGVGQVDGAYDTRQIGRGGCARGGASRGFFWRGPAIEKFAGGRVYRLRIVTIALVELGDIAGVGTLEIEPWVHGSILAKMGVGRGRAQVGSGV
jgi:hypothetical protein